MTAAAQVWNNKRIFKHYKCGIGHGITCDSLDVHGAQLQTDLSFNSWAYYYSNDLLLCVFSVCWRVCSFSNRQFKPHGSTRNTYSPELLGMDCQIRMQSQHLVTASASCVLQIHKLVYAPRKLFWLVCNWYEMYIWAACIRYQRTWPWLLLYYLLS